MFNSAASFNFFSCVCASLVLLPFWQGFTMDLWTQSLKLSVIVLLYVHAIRSLIFYFFYFFFSFFLQTFLEKIATQTINKVVERERFRVETLAVLFRILDQLWQATRTLATKPHPKLKNPHAALQHKSIRHIVDTAYLSLHYRSKSCYIAVNPLEGASLVLTLEFLLDLHTAAAKADSDL